VLNPCACAGVLAVAAVGVVGEGVNPLYALFKVVACVCAVMAAVFLLLTAEWRHRDVISLPQATAEAPALTGDRSAALIV